MITISFRTDNAAFDEAGTGHEAARILIAIADRLHRGETEGTCRDANGNTVGAWSLVDHRNMDD